MPRSRTTLLVLLALAAAAGFCAGWVVHSRTDPSIEARAHRAADHLRDAARDLTR
jgi:hypothetical protein